MCQTVSNYVFVYAPLECITFFCLPLFLFLFCRWREHNIKFMFRRKHNFPLNTCPRVHFHNKSLCCLKIYSLNHLKTILLKIKKIVQRSTKIVILFACDQNNHIKIDMKFSLFVHSKERKIKLNPELFTIYSISSL